jgi:V/A-type H+/Na+-transporting ATPase subunit G/H
LEQKISSVEDIVKALSELEKEMDNLNSKVAEMKKRIIAYSTEEIENLRQQTISIANEEAKKILATARAEAEEESSMIVKETDKSLGVVKKNINSSYDKAVDNIIKMILGEFASSNSGSI